MSKQFRDWNVEQEYLFPPSIKDFVPEEHLAHFVRELVREELDLQDIVNDYVEERGYPPYDPRMMTAVLLYGYMQGLYSSRKIARACEERVDFMAVSGMNKPDFRTVAKFRKRHLSALGELFVQVLKLCKAAKLVKLGHVALDGSKVKANASKRRGKSYKRLKQEESLLREEVQRWFREAEAVDAEEDESFGEAQRGDELPAWVADSKERLKRIRAARKTLEKRDKEERKAREQAEREGRKPPSKTKKTDRPKDTKRYNFSDPDSEMLRGPEGFIQGYNTQVAVDSGHHVIVACHISNAKNDLNELIPALKQIENNLGEQARELSADGGYCSEENLKALTDQDIRGYVAVGRDPPEGKQITRETPYAYDMRQRLRKAGKRSRYRLRKYTVEPVFGVIKAARGFRQFLLRGIENVENEWKLVCTAQNLHKLAAART